MPKNKHRMLTPIPPMKIGFFKHFLNVSIYFNAGLTSAKCGS